jgi:hypothetical protein
MRMVFSDKYDIDATLTGGDISITEVPLAQMPALLSGGQVDAAYVYLQALYRLNEDRSLKSIAFPQKEYAEHFDAVPVIGLRITFGRYVSDVGANKILDLRDMLDKAKKRYNADPAPIDESVAAASDIPVGFFEFMRSNMTIGGPMPRKELSSSLKVLFDGAAELGELEGSVKVAPLLLKRR